MSHRDILEADGFVHLGSHAPRASTLEVSERLGRVAVVPGYALSQQLTPKAREEATPTSYSGAYGLASFPLHTDLAHWAIPPRYLLLRCIRGEAGVATPLLDGQLVIESIGAIALFRALVQPRRPLNGRLSLLRLLDRPSSGTPLLRWDERFIRPVTVEAKRVFGEVHDSLASIPKFSPELSEPGDTLLVDNWRMLHGRSPVAVGSSRVIERVYMEAIH